MSTKFLVVIQKGRRQPCLFSFCIETAKKTLAGIWSSLHLCSENCISWIFGPFFKNAHEWKPHHGNPHEPKTQCIWFLVTGRSNEKNNVKTIFCLGSEWVIRNIVLSRFLYAHPPLNVLLSTNQTIFTWWVWKIISNKLSTLQHDSTCY